MIFLTAKPRTGKSTAIGIGLDNCLGFYSEEVRLDQDRVGFQIRTISGRCEVFAHVDSESNIRFGRYGVNVELMEEVLIAELRKALADTDNRVVVIDEIGPMQMYSDKLKELLIELADSGKVVIGTIFFNPYQWIDEFKQRSDVELIQLTLENRDELVGKLVSRVKNGVLLVS